jgi:hypothetical protein
VEAQIAAGALRASGLNVVVEEAARVGSSVGLIHAPGGVRLLGQPDEADAARAFIADRRAEPSKLAPLAAEEAAVRTIASLVVTLLFNIVTPFSRRRGRLQD